MFRRFCRGNRHLTDISPRQTSLRPPRRRVRSSRQASRRLRPCCAARLRTRHRPRPDAEHPAGRAQAQAPRDLTRRAHRSISVNTGQNRRSITALLERYTAANCRSTTRAYLTEKGSKRPDVRVTIERYGAVVNGRQVRHAPDPRRRPLSRGPVSGLNRENRQNRRNRRDRRRWNALSGHPVLSRCLGPDLLHDPLAPIRSHHRLLLDGIGASLDGEGGA